MGTFDAFQRLVWSPQFKQNCFPHRSKMGVLKSFPDGMKVVQTYKNGVANGWQKNYNSQGALMGEIMMKNGRATGEFRAYDSRGNIVQEGTHEDNVVSTVKGMSSPRPEPNEVSPNDNGGIMIKEVNE